MATDKTAAEPAAQKFASVAELTAAYPDLVATIQANAKPDPKVATDAAEAERKRITGIQALAAGRHAKIVAEMIADGTAVEAAAVRIVTADNQARADQLQAVKDVEAETGQIPSAALGSDREQKKPKAKTPDGWKAEFEASEALQGEFASAESYVAFQQATASGRARLLTSKADA